MESKWRFCFRRVGIPYPRERCRKRWSIICCTTLLCHDRAWDEAIGEAVRELRDEKTTQYIFKRNGRGTPGHLRIREAEEMAEELTAYIEKLDIEW